MQYKELIMETKTFSVTFYKGPAFSQPQTWHSKESPQRIIQAIIISETINITLIE